MYHLVIAHLLLLPGDDEGSLRGVVVLPQRHVESVYIVGVLRNAVFLSDQEVDQLVRQVLVLALAHHVDGCVDFAVTALNEELQSSLILHADGVIPVTTTGNKERKKEIVNFCYYY